jgi:hypothetical protein
LDAPGKSVSLTDVPDSCYRRVCFSFTTPGRFGYGDQVQEVAWEVQQERFEAKRGQEAKQHEVARTFGSSRERLERIARHIREAIGVGEDEQLLDAQKQFVVDS